MYQVADTKKKGLVLWTCLLLAVGVELVALTSVMFPNLILLSTSKTPDFFGINRFEMGAMAVPLLATNFAILGFGILYYKKRMPKKITGGLNFITHFEISPRLTLLVMILLIGGFITFSVTQLYIEEPFPDYKNRVLPGLQSWTLDSVTKGFDVHLKNFLDVYSMKVFGTYRVAPFLESISLLVVVFYFTKLITKSRFAGVVSVTILLQSTLFLLYNSSATYDNSWILLYLLSLYLIYKFWPLSPVSFIASLFTKPITVVFLPFSMFFIYRADISKRRKIFSEISYAFVIAIGVFTAIKFGAVTSVSGINIQGFWSAFNAFAYQLRFDDIVVLFLLPVTVVLFLVSRKGVAHGDSILLLLMSMVLLQPMVALLSTANLSEPYRFVSLITFFAISVGVLLSKNITLKE